LKILSITNYFRLLLIRIRLTQKLLFLKEKYLKVQELERRGYLNLLKSVQVIEKERYFWVAEIEGIQSKSLSL